MPPSLLTFVSAPQIVVNKKAWVAIYLKNKIFPRNKLLPEKKVKRDKMFYCSYLGPILALVPNTPIVFFQGLCRRALWSCLRSKAQARILLSEFCSPKLDQSPHQNCHPPGQVTSSCVWFQFILLACFFTTFVLGSSKAVKPFHRTESKCNGY